MTNLRAASRWRKCEGQGVILNTTTESDVTSETGKGDESRETTRWPMIIQIHFHWYFGDLFTTVSPVVSLFRTVSHRLISRVSLIS